jgi:hypothetical protein
VSLDTLSIFLDGGRVTLSLLVAVAFLRLGRTTGDRLYHGFALAFVLMAASNVLVGLGLEVGESKALVFVPRLVAFLLIIAAIVDKNRRSRR